MLYLEQIKNDSQTSSLRGIVFARIEDDILNGRYKVGESLIESKLSEELGVSRTPIREALRQLELEGLVQSIPNKGVVVKGISSQDIEDIYTIRMLIEGLAARWAAEKITRAELEELKEAIELEEFYTARNDAIHLAKLDSRFHDIVFRASKSKPLMQTLISFHHYIQRARNASFKSPERAERALKEHRGIFKAIAGGDADKAEKLTTEHVRNANVNLIKNRTDDGEAGRNLRRGKKASNRKGG